MALDNFPWEAFMQAQQMKNKNQQQMNQDIGSLGQGLGQGIGAISEMIQKKKQKDLMNQLVQQMQTQGAPQQGPPMAPPQAMGQVPPNQPMSAGPMGIGQDVQMPQQPQPPPMSGMGGPAQDNSKQIQALLMQLDPEGAIKQMMEQQDPMRQAELGLKKAQTSLYNRKANDPGKALTDVYRNISTGELTDDPATAVGPEWKKYPVGQTTALQTLTSRGARESKGWDTVSPEDKDMAKALYEGRIRTKDTSFKERGTLTKLANEYAIKNKLPPFKSYAGDVAGGTAQGFATGKLGMNSLALNTALGHVSSAYEAYENMRNTDQAWLNEPLNALKKKTNNPDVIKLGLTLNALRGELATVFKGSAGTDLDAKSWHDFLTENLTPKQINGAIPQIDELLRSRLSALDYQRSSGMSGRSEAPLLSPHAAAISKKFGDKQPNKLGKEQEDQQAIMWAKQNANDPRARKILQLHGL